jgi:hypothetical protein
MKRALMLGVASLLAMGVFLGSAPTVEAKGHTRKAYKPAKKHVQTYKKASYHVSLVTMQ